MDPVRDVTITESAPKKFIRTFASDMEAARSAPRVAKESQPTRAVETPALAVPAPAQSEAPTVRPQSQLETYAGDFSDRMQTLHASTATVLAAEQDARPVPGAKPIPDAQPKGNALYIVGGIICIVLGAVGAYAAYVRYLANAEPVALVPVVVAPIFVDERQEVTGTGAELLTEIRRSLTDPPAAGTIRFLHLPLAAPANASIFKALELAAPGALERNVRGEGSMAGIIAPPASSLSTEGASPFFILAVESFSETFAAMLAWETRMHRDLDALFPQGAPVATGTTTAPTVAAGFNDEVVANHDARVYRGPSGAVSLIYGYWDQSTLVIARDREAFSELIGRLGTSRKR